ncbi:hypothetical protein ACIQU4_18430 [Streptomyces sp. NPDC090741]|uniref:hypothetical protein n=1 Tax=Streptomyces sp. NPDC090741 TaxID=3365967 RepID=UPI0038126192
MDIIEGLGACLGMTQDEFRRRDLLGKVQITVPHRRPPVVGVDAELPARAVAAESRQNLYLAAPREQFLRLLELTGTGDLFTIEPAGPAVLTARTAWRPRTAAPSLRRVRAPDVRAAAAPLDQQGVVQVTLQGILLERVTSSLTRELRTERLGGEPNVWWAGGIVRPVSRRWPVERAGRGVCVPGCCRRVRCPGTAV